MIEYAFKIFDDSCSYYVRIMFHRASFFSEKIVEGGFLTKFLQLFNKTWGVKGEIIEKK